MAGEKGPTKRSAMDIKRLASLIQRGTGRLLVIDSRTFSEYNASHVQSAVNVCCSKLVKRRLQQDKVSVTELLQPNGKVKVSEILESLSWIPVNPVIQHKIPATQRTVVVFVCSSHTNKKPV